MTFLKSAPVKSTLVAGGVVMELLFLFYRMFDLGPSGTVIKYIVISLLTFVITLIIFLMIKNHHFKKSDFYVVFLFTVIFYTTLVPCPPDLSDDIYRYIWDGKLQAEGVNPFQYAPDDPYLYPYHSPSLPAMVNFPEIKTIYPPVTQVIFYLSYLMFQESVLGLKIIFSLFAMGSCLLFYSLVARTFAGRSLSLLFCWSPLVVMETAVNGHLEIVMVFFLLLTIYFLQRSEFLLTGLAFSGAVLSKLFPVILLPLLIQIILSRGKKAAAIVKFTIAFIVSSTFGLALYAPAIVNMLKTAFNYSSKWYFNNPLFHLMNTVFKDNAIAHLVSFSCFGLLFTLIFFKKLSPEKKIYYALASFVMLNPTIHPWYLITLVALLAVHYFEPALIWSGLVVLSYVVVYNFKITGIWNDSAWQLAFQYLPVLVSSLIFWFFRKRFFYEPDRVNESNL